MAHHSGLPPSLAPIVLPAITVSSHDLARLEALIESPQLSRHPAALALAAELSRATILPPLQMPDGIVTMHARVHCEDVLRGEHHALTLVYPHEADAARQLVSVLAPVGSALLGLAVGQSIDWQAPDGRALRLKVTAIDYQPHAAPGYHP